MFDIYLVITIGNIVGAAHALCYLNNWYDEKYSLRRVLVVLKYSMWFLVSSIIIWRLMVRIDHNDKILKNVKYRRKQYIKDIIG